jgi:hypothetical protein
VPVKKPRDMPEWLADTATKSVSTDAAASPILTIPPPPKPVGNAAKEKGDGKAAGSTFSFGSLNRTFNFSQAKK